MGTTAYYERDYTFGQAMLTLRTEIGLTQAGLANQLGVSRRAVGEWEAGSSYPKTHHLKGLIALGVKCQAFRAGHEEEDIRALWKMAGQKVLLDEHWLSTLFSQQRSLHLHLVSKAVEGSMPEGPCRKCGRSLSSCTCPPVEPPAVSSPRVDWGDALAVPTFYGRAEELAQLSQWVVQERCRIVSVLGMGGIGKSALSVSTMYQVSGHFEVVIFRSLRDAPSCEVLLDDCLQVLTAQPRGEQSSGQMQGKEIVGENSVLPTPTHTEQRISLLLSYLRKVRVLVVLDNLESLLEAGNVKGHLRPGFEGYGQLLRRVAETGHQSCLLVTSREKLAELRPLESKHSPVRSLRLSGLDEAACKQLLAEKDVIGTEAEQERLIEIYGGNPLALKIVAETIFDLFGGEIGLFLAEETLIFGSIADLLGEQFARLSELEQSVLYWLAIVREPMTLEELQELLVAPLPRIEVLEAFDGLYRRSLIERGKHAGSFTLQSVALEYVTTVLIVEASREIQEHRLNRLIRYGLELAHVKEYVRQMQERLLLIPLLMDLQSSYRRPVDGSGQEPRTVANPVPTPPTAVEGLLLDLLDELRELADSAQGYGPANLIALLRVLRGHLSGLDLSKLSVRGAYLQDVEMHNTKLSKALIRDSVWTSAVSATWAVAISLDGKWWATGSLQGKVRVWEGGRSQTLRLIWQAHTDTVSALAFSPDGRTLASGSTDDTVKLWDVDSGTLLWTSWQNGPQTLAFSPDGTLLASGGMDATVRLWDPRKGKHLQTLTHPGHVFAVAFSPDGCQLASGCSADGEIRLWERQKGSPATYVQALSVQTGGVTSLAFAPDGKTLASVSIRDQTVKLWEVAGLRLLHTLSGHANSSRCVAWSPDGRALAYSSSDKAIQLWDVEEGRHRAVLRGHTADVCGIVFTSEGTKLLSGSADSTLRVWDVEYYRCIRVMHGYGVSLWDLDWSPDSMFLVSGDTDGLVTIWDVRDGMPIKSLHGHSWVVTGVGWSPNGRYLSSCGLDTVLLLWDPTSGACIQRFEHSPVVFQCMAWSPDGSLLACGTYQRGIHVWNIAERRLLWVGQPDVVRFLRVAWSPDGTCLVGAAHDVSVYLWESTDGTRFQRLPGHHGSVMSLAWSPDGTKLASGSGSSSNGELFLWDMRTCRVCRDGACSHPSLVRTFAGQPDRVYALAWSPMGDLLISGGNDGKLRWWNVRSGECFFAQKAHQGIVHTIKVSPDGKFLASCGEDGAITIWDLTSREHLRTLRRNRPYERLDITGIRGLNEAQKNSLHALGAIEETIPCTKIEAPEEAE